MRAAVFSMTARPGALLPVFMLLLFLHPGALAAEQDDCIGAAGAIMARLEDSNPGSDECDLGSYVADAVKTVTGADIAIVNSGDIVNDLAAGAVTLDDIRGVFAEDRELVTAVITPRELWPMLETALSRIVVDPETESIDREASDFGGFAQISGFSIKYDASARAGERVYSVSLADGTTLLPEDDETQISLAATKYMLGGGYGYAYDGEYAEADMTLFGALAGYIRSGGGGAAGITDGRVTALGTAEGTISEAFPRWLIILSSAGVSAIFLLVNTQRRTAEKALPLKRNAV